MRFQIEQLYRDRQGLEAKLKAQKKEIEEVKRDLDIKMNEFLGEEAVGKDKAVTFQLTFKQARIFQSLHSNLDGKKYSLTMKIFYI